MPQNILLGEGITDFTPVLAPNEMKFIPGVLYAVSGSIPYSAHQYYEGYDSGQNYHTN